MWQDSGKNATVQAFEKKTAIDHIQQMYSILSFYILSYFNAQQFCKI